MVRSCIQTAPEVDVAVYIDEDQRRLYGWVEEERAPKQLKVTFGLRIGPVASINHLIEKHSDYDCYGFVLDDCRFGTLGWDKFIEEFWEKDGPYTSIGMIAPAKNTGEHGDMLFVTKGWIAALGWFAWPGCYHWGWDAIMSSLGHAAGVYYQANPKEFWITHDVLLSMNRDRYPADIVQLYDFFSNYFQGSLKQLKAAM